MAEDDIYGSKQKYERWKANADGFASKSSTRKYYCRNRANIRYFKQLFANFEAKDISYIRRTRILQTIRVVCYLTSKDLADCDRDDVNSFVAAMHEIYATPKSKQTFIADLKHIWKLLFPERDVKGRPDETIVPYPVRHLSCKIDKSRQKLRRDKLTWEEFDKLVNYFGSDPRIQAYLTISLESLARPQELLYLRIRDVELHDNYAKVYLSEHGKEGVGLLQCIDSYPYLLKWLGVHPLRTSPDAFLFVNTGDTNRLQQLRPQNINKLVRTACGHLGIDKPITCYSLKRNGITLRRLRGDSDMEIQHAARWTSTKQLKTYDMSNQEEAFRMELEKRGLIPSSDGRGLDPKKCEFCGKPSGFGETLCLQCKRPLDRSAIREEIKSNESEIAALRKSVAEIAAAMQDFKRQVLSGLASEIPSPQNIQPAAVPSRQPRQAAAGNGTALASPLANGKC